MGLTRAHVRRTLAAKTPTSKAPTSRTQTTKAQAARPTTAKRPKTKAAPAAEKHAVRALPKAKTTTVAKTR